MMSETAALITGASGGIGMELARIFAREGRRLALVARNEAKLNALAAELAERWGTESLVIPLDLTAPDADERLYRVLQERGVHIDELVNNAGFGDYGPFRESDAERIESMLQLNVIALTKIARRFLPDLMERRGRLMNVASTAAFQPGPYMAAYFASKAYVLSFTQALAAELKPKGVSVTCLCPGPADTGFLETAQIGSPRIFRTNLLDSRRVAKAGYKAMMRGKRVAVVGNRNKLLAFAARIAPRNLTARVLKYLLTDPDQKPDGDGG